MDALPAVSVCLHRGGFCCLFVVHLAFVLRRGHSQLPQVGGQIDQAGPPEPLAGDASILDPCTDAGNREARPPGHIGHALERGVGRFVDTIHRLAPFFNNSVM